MPNNSIDQHSSSSMYRHISDSPSGFIKIDPSRRSGNTGRSRELVDLVYTKYIGRTHHPMSRTRNRDDKGRQAPPVGNVPEGQAETHLPSKPSRLLVHARQNVGFPEHVVQEESQAKHGFLAEDIRLHGRRLTHACAIILSRHGRASRARINAGPLLRKDPGRHCKVRNSALCAFRTASYQKVAQKPLYPKKSFSIQTYYHIPVYCYQRLNLTLDKYHLHLLRHEREHSGSADDAIGRRWSSTCLTRRSARRTRRSFI